MGVDKLLFKYQGKSIIQCAIDLLSDLPVYEKIVVTTSERLEHAMTTPDIQIVINKSPENGQSGSIRLGIEKSTGTYYFFIAADQPRLTAGAIIPLLELAKKNVSKIIFPNINGNPCSPTLFPAAFREELLALSGDIGGRAVRDANPESCCAFKPEHPELFIDIDNANDYIALNSER